MSNLIANLNRDHRVVLSQDAREWFLERYDEIDGCWRARSRCRTQPALMNCVRLYAGDVDAEARAILESLPFNVWWPTAAPKKKRPKKRGAS
jgi:hypothetical protein